MPLDRRSPLFPRPGRAWLATLAWLAAPVASLAARPAAPPSPSYERDVLPLFKARCGACHGAGNPEAGLDIRTHGDLMQGGYSGTPVVKGAPEKSLLYQMLADGRMPKGKRFDAAELKVVANWIRAGAPGTTGVGGHWSFRAPKAAVPPRVKAETRVRNPIDRFLLAALEAKGLTYSPEADRRTLIRRLSFDLLGVPPTPEEVDAYLTDALPDAYERLVDRLLADPRYGERWARHWLDTAGYADSEGVLQEDRIRPNAWRYRDYVIRALNGDKPYDQFLREQIAGDELVDYKNVKAFTPEVVDKLAATGFLRTSVDATRDDFNMHQFGEYQYRMLHDTQTIAVSTTMGLTVHCARCHDHKYEPVSQNDYYKLQALFTGGVRPRGALLPTNRRQIVAATAEEQANAKKVNAEVDAALGQLNARQAAATAEHQAKYLETNLAKAPEAERQPLLTAARTAEAQRTPEQKALVAKHAALVAAPAATLSATSADYRAAMAEIEKERAAQNVRRISLTELRAFYDQDAAPPPTPLLIRGEWLRPGTPVAPGIPSQLDDARSPFAIPAPTPGAYSTGRRTAFAQWLTRPDHPLTARVMVNRVWAHHFGVGIVPSVDNFGRSGQRPTNQALLDWLAASFTEPGTSGQDTRGTSGLGWSVKRLHRFMVTSAAYRQASGWREAAGAADPENRLLWRQRARRLEAEAVRDGMLAVTGTLDATMFGAPVDTVTVGTGEIVPAGEEKGGRRSIYLLSRRSLPVTLLNVFDQPVMETNCTRRTLSATPTQALALMNSTFVSSQADHFARRLLKERPGGGAAAIDRAYRLALGRPPSAAEAAAALAFLAEQPRRYPAGTAKPEERALADFCQALLSSNGFVYVD